ncbi:glycosyltransferase family 4 protein [Spirulina major]|uniref:glycosyltransferase family 4 protein n=1 Tax=Spirulina major TaxID=270636 RepID=UPI000933D02E|nr:glycosyltransferase family 4 protein [Spirulina major]
MPIGLIHPTGNPFARQAAQALAELGELGAIATSLAYNPDRPWAKSLSHRAPALAQELSRRTWIAPPGVPLYPYPTREILRLLLLRTGLPQRCGYNPQRLTDWVYRGVDRAVARHHLHRWAGVYAYEDGAAAMFAIAASLGLTCFYDLPIVYYRRSQQIQQAEADRFPELAPALLSLHEPAAKLARKDFELHHADRIIVPSTQVKQSLAPTGIDPDRVSVVPFGAPVDYLYPSPQRDRPVRILFVGRVGPRKGVHHLIQGWRSLQPLAAELHLVGINEFPPGWLDPERDRFTYHPSIPHHHLIHHYHRASVFVLPSLIEGLALVLLEAMACGLPIITTPNSGAADILTDGVEGWLIPAGDAEAIASRLQWCVEHPDELAAMGRAARRRAEIYTWERYRTRLKTVITHTLTLPKRS